MFGGILRRGVPGEAMECGLQVEVYGLLRQAAFHTETDLYHRWVRFGNVRLVSVQLALHVRGLIQYSRWPIVAVGIRPGMQSLCVERRNLSGVKTVCRNLLSLAISSLLLVIDARLLRNIRWSGPIEYRAGIFRIRVSTDIYLVLKFHLPKRSWMSYRSSCIHVLCEIFDDARKMFMFFSYFSFFLVQVQL